MVKDHGEEIDDLQSLVELYSTKDLKWANRLYELALAHLESQTDISTPEESSFLLKTELMAIAHRNYSH